MPYCCALAFWAHGENFNWRTFCGKTTWLPQTARLSAPKIDRMIRNEWMFCGNLLVEDCRRLQLIGDSWLCNVRYIIQGTLPRRIISQQGIGFEALVLLVSMGSIRVFANQQVGEPQHFLKISQAWRIWKIEGFDGMESLVQGYKIVCDIVKPRNPFD